MSSPDAPKPTIGKKKSRKAAKETKKLANGSVEISLVIIKSVSSSTMKQLTAEPSSACRKLDLANVNLLELGSGGESIKTTGALLNYAKKYLKTNKFGKAVVNITCTVIRWPVPEEWEGFRFLLFSDHTGCVSIASTIETFSSVQMCKDDSVPRSAVTIKGTINFKWSSKKVKEDCERELYINIRRNAATISLAECLFFPQSFSAFQTMKKIMGMQYNSSATFPFLLGDCVLIQDDVETSKNSFMLQDAKGFAVVQVTGWDFAEGLPDEENLGYGAMLFRGCFNLEVVEVNGVDGISTFVEKNNFTFTKPRDSLLTRHITMIKTTEKESYMFPFDGKFDVRSA